jgi:hypothetical protein
MARLTPINVAVILQEMKPVMTTLPLSLKVSLGTYSRDDNPHRKYLNPNLSIDKMYELYIRRNVIRKRELRYAVNGCTEKRLMRALIYRLECK